MRQFSGPVSSGAGAAAAAAGGAGQGRACESRPGLQLPRPHPTPWLLLRRRPSVDSACVFLQLIGYSGGVVSAGKTTRIGSTVSSVPIRARAVELDLVCVDRKKLIDQVG